MLELNRGMDTSVWKFVLEVGCHGIARRKGGLLEGGRIFGYGEAEAVGAFGVAAEGAAVLVLWEGPDPAADVAFPGYCDVGCTC